MKKFISNFVKGNLSLWWIVFILFMVIPFTILFIDIKFFEIPSVNTIYFIYLFFASIIVWITAMKNKSHPMHQISTFLSGIVLFICVGIFLFFLGAIILFLILELSEWIVN